MAEHKVGNTVVLVATIVEIQDTINGTIAWVKVDKSVPDGNATIAVRLGTLPAAPYDAVHGDERARLLDAMAEEQDHPGRTITR